MTATDLTPRWITTVMTSSRHRPRRTFWFAFLAFFAVSGIWAFSNPLMASVDEPAHVVKAAATVRGAEDISEDGSTTGIGLVEIPQLYLQLATYPNCFAFNPESSVACQQVLSGDFEVTTRVETSAMNYNPLYYTLVGWPSLLPGGEHTVYMMRLVNALVVSALLAFAARLIAGLPRRRWIGLALLLPLTPTFVNLLGSVNPQSFEVAGAVLLWVSLLALLRSPDPTQTGIRLLGVVVATIPLANARSLGPLMVVIILVLCVLSAPWRRTLDVFKDRRSWVAAAVCVLACALSLVWTLSQDALPEGAGDNGLVLRDIIFQTLGLTSAYVQQMFFALGWLDVPVPMWTIFLLISCVALIAFAGWALGTFRDRLVLSLSAGIVFALPVVSHVVQADKIGYFWQGRYAFPIALGVALLAGFAVSRREALIPDWVSLNLVTTVALTFAGLQVVAFWANLHRYAVGASGGWFLRQPLPWLPVPAALLTAIYAAAWCALVVVVLRATTPQTDDDVVGAPPVTTSDLADQETARP